jgi:hypothetical protein
VRPLSALVLAAGLAALGCSSPTAPPAPTAATAKSEGHGHSHSRDKMLAADVGKLHGWLTAHLSRQDGNELDIFFETEDGKPAPIPVAKFAAKAKRAADESEHELAFEPAPMDERTGDPPGSCSHFVAKAPWMARDDVLTVRAEVELDGKPRRATWRGFEVKRYAHHED